MTHDLNWNDLAYLLDKINGVVGISLWREGMSKWERFGYVWEWATKQEWWDAFESLAYGEWEDIEDADNFSVWFVNPVRFPQLMVDFLRDGGGWKV